MLLLTTQQQALILERKIICYISHINTDLDQEKQLLWDCQSATPPLSAVWCWRKSTLNLSASQLTRPCSKRTITVTTKLVRESDTVKFLTRDRLLMGRDSIIIIIWRYDSRIIIMRHEYPPLLCRRQSSLINPSICLPEVQEASESFILWSHRQPLPIIRFCE